MVIPFALSPEELRESTIRVNGVVIERMRLLLPGREGGTWLPSDLDEELVVWCQTTQSYIPRLS